MSGRSATAPAWWWRRPRLPRRRGADPRERRAPEKGVRLAEHQSHEVLQHRLADRRRREIERHGLQTVDVAQAHHDHAAAVIGDEPDGRHDGRHDGEHAAPRARGVVLFDPVREIELRAAQPLLHRGGRGGRDHDADRQVVRHPVIELEALDEVETREHGATVRHDAAVVARRRNRGNTLEGEPVSDHRAYHFEVRDRLVEPAKCGEQPAIDVPQVRRPRSLRRGIGIAHRRRTLAQLGEHRRRKRGGHGCRL